MRLTDTHCHLDFCSFDQDRAEVLDRARRAGVMRILNPGIDLESSQRIIRLAEGEPLLYAAVGVHPNEAESWTEATIDALEQLSKHEKVVAIGEIGLDYYRNQARREIQREAFRRQLELAANCNLPVVVHNRDADSEVVEILCEWQQALCQGNQSLAQRPGVLHSYSGSVEAAQMAIEHNFMIGVTGPITYRNADRLRHTITQVPLKHLLIETDAPFLPPQPRRGERNEPAFVNVVAEKLAELFQTTVATVAEQTSVNADKLFQW